MAWLGVIFMLAVAMTALSMLAFSEDDGAYRGEGLLTVHYLDVGQSDCTFVEVGGEYTMMIDASDEAHADEICRYVDALGYDSIDLLVLTHSHSDHIGGAASVLSALVVERVYMTDGTATGEDAEHLRRVEEMIEAHGVERAVAQEGTEFELGGLEGCFLAPGDVYFSDENEMSAVLSLRYGEQSFLFMGDAGEAAENMLLRRGADVLATVVKAGHHGSNGSSTQDFVSAARAEYVVFSCGEGNDYGHPSPYAVDRWEAAGARTFRTDRDSTVIACTDGVGISVMRLSESKLLGDAIFSGSDTSTYTETVAAEHKYYLNTASHILHLADCTVFGEELGTNIEPSSEDIARLRAEGYKTCMHCFE